MKQKSDSEGPGGEVGLLAGCIKVVSIRESRVLSAETVVEIYSCNGDPRIFFNIVFGECSILAKGYALPRYSGTRDLEVS